MKNISLAGPGAYARTIPYDNKLAANRADEYPDMPDSIKMKYLQEYIEDEMV